MLNKQLKKQRRQQRLEQERRLYGSSVKRRRLRVSGQLSERARHFKSPGNSKFIV